MKARNCITGALLFSLCLAGAGCKKNKTDSGPDQIYLAGYVTNTGKYVPCYWKNGEQIDFARINSDRNGYVYSIFASGGDVYVAGYNENASGIYVPCYWKNGTRTDLSRLSDSRSGIANAIVISNGTKYATRSNYVAIT